MELSIELQEINNLSETICNVPSLSVSSRYDITKEYQKKNAEVVSKILPQLLDGAEMTADIARSIRPDKTYLAEIPRTLQDGFKDGKFNFMQIKETGERLGTIVSTSTAKFVGQVRIKEAPPMWGRLFMDLQSIITRQNFIQINAALDSLQASVDKIIEIHDAELLGELEGMMGQIIQALSCSDIDRRNRLIEQTITQVNVTRGKISQRLLVEIRNFPEIPWSIWDSKKYRYRKQEWDCLWTNLYVEAQNGHAKIQHLMNCYLAASQLLAYAYSLLDEKTDFSVFCSFDFHGVPLYNLRRCSDLWEIREKQWYDNPAEFFSAVETELRRLCDNSSANETVTIQVTGSQLLENMDSDIEQQKKDQEVIIGGMKVLNYDELSHHMACKKNSDFRKKLAL